MTTITRSANCRDCRDDLADNVSFESTTRAVIHHFFGSGVTQGARVLLGGNRCRESVNGSDCTLDDQGRVKGAYVDSPIVDGQHSHQ